MLDVQYYIRWNAKKTRVRLVVRYNRGNPSAKTTTEIKPDERIDSLNHLLDLGLIKPSEAAKKASLIAVEFRARANPQPTLATANIKIQNAYLEEVVYPKPNEEPDAARNRITRAVKALGEVDLNIASPREIMDQLSKIENNASRRSATDVITQLLKFIERTKVRLHKPRKERKPVDYLTVEQFQVALAAHKGPDIEKLVLWCGFGSGARLGEIWGITEVTKDLRAAYIDHQWKRKNKKWKKAAPKNNRARWAATVKEARPHIKAWMALSHEEQMAVRGLRWADIIGGLSPIPGISFHDLRHSYAIHMLRQGYSLEKIARWIGDSITVCQESYTGYVGTLADLEGVS